VEELLQLIQRDPELWEIVEQLKGQDEEPMDFFLNVANMLAVEFEEMHRTDLTDKLVALFGGLPEPAFKMVPLLLHVALDIFLMRAIPSHDSIKG
jgi:hypothetical protein|tara:strand:+ start:1426 stop:1710 length:285 start_codon:yes stop_codon:yes gene_type:complete